MSNMLPMEEILNIFNKNKNYKLTKKKKFIKDIHIICNDIVKIIKECCDFNDGILIEFDDTFNCDIRELKYDEVIFLIQNIDDISSFLLLLTSLLSNYTTKLNYELSYNQIFDYFNNIDEKFKEKIEKPVYNSKRVLKDLYKIERKLVNTNYKQSKYILNCFALFILLPIINNYKFKGFFSKKYYKNNKFNKINRNLMSMLSSYLSKNPLIYKTYKKYQTVQKISNIRYLFNIFNKILNKIFAILSDILTFIYFLLFGIKSINTEIEKYEKELVKKYEILRTATRNVVNNINNKQVLNDLIDYLNNINKDFETEYGNECKFSNSSNQYILFANKYLKEIIKDYIYLKKYLYNERDFLNNIKR